MNKVEWIDRTAKRASVSYAQAELILMSGLKTIEKTIENGDPVQLVGFGTFIAKRDLRIPQRDPETGASVWTEPKTRAVFNPGKRLREAAARSTQES